MPTFALKGIGSSWASENCALYVFYLLGFNSSCTLLYAAKKERNFEHQNSIAMLFRISIFGQSMHEITRFEIPFSQDELMFDPATEEIYSLNHVRVSEFPNENYLSLLIFNAKTGNLKRYYHENGVHPFGEIIINRLLTVSNGDIFMGGATDFTSIIYVYQVSGLDDINATFDLSPIGKLPPSPVGVLWSVKNLIEIAEDRAILKFFDQIRHVEYCKFDGEWVEEAYAVSPQNAEPFQLLRGEHVDENWKLEFGLSDNHLVYRVLKVIGHDEWEIERNGHVPYTSNNTEFYRPPYSYSSSGDRMAFFAMENSTLHMTIQLGQPSSLEEVCIGVLWPYVGRLNPELTDHEIWCILELPKTMKVEKYFGSFF